MFSHLLTSKALRALAALAGVAVSDRLIAADPPPAATARPVSISDTTLAVSVLAALDADPVLKRAQFVVSVVDRGVVVWGPVPTEAMRKRAEEVVRTVPGIESVKNTCFVADDPDPLLRAAANRMKPRDEPAAPARPGLALPPVTADRVPPNGPVQPPSDLIAGTADKTVVAQHMNALGAPVGVLGAPMLPRAANGTTAPTTAPGALTGSVGEKAADVLTAVASVRASEPRFAKLAVEVKSDGGLFVTGSVPKAADAWDFVAQLRKVPGVPRIAVDPKVVR